MKPLAFLLLIATLFSSCQSSTIPSDIIPKEKMQAIIWQLMQSDEYVNALVARDTTKKSSTERMKRYQEIFDLNKTSPDEFKKSYRFYIEHPDITKVMFDSISTKATRDRTLLYQPKPDSISAKANMERIQMEKRRSDSIGKAMQSLRLRKTAAADTTSKNKKIPLRLRKPKKVTKISPAKKT